MAKKVHQLLIRFDEKMYKKLSEISLDRGETMQKYIKYVLANTINTDDITVQEQSLLKDTVKLISFELQTLFKDSVKVMAIDLFREIEKMNSHIQTENQLAMEKINSEFRNIYKVLNQLYKSLQ